SYTDSYAGPAHTPGDWLVTTPAAAGQNGQREQACTLCGVVITRQEIIPAATCTLASSRLELAPGDTAQLTATLQPPNATDTGLVFASSDDTIATVDQTGLVTAHKAGSVTLTVTSADGFATAATTLTVAGPFPVVWVIVGAIALVVIVLVPVLVRAARRKKQRARRARQSTRNTYTRR
ncbi:MAG: Ig domain-containing protein, partial [Ruminococcaceae bacterium]|nr:Ig domain-containing protein [Oscillospiraceae bacterium]